MLIILGLCCGMAAAAAARWGFGVGLSLSAALLDGAAVALVLLSLRPALRGTVAAASVGMVLAALVTVGSAVKIAYLGAPIYPGDIASARELFQILPIGVEIAIVAATCALAVVVGAALNLRSGGWHALLWLSAAALLCLWQAPNAQRLLDRVLPVPPHDDAKRFVLQGAVVPLMARFEARLRDADAAPGLLEVRSALHGLSGAGATAVADGAPRNVHLLLLESMWDPTQLVAYKFSRDPFDARFRSLWERGGSSTALVPTLGGATANAEFEALCGLPSHPTDVVFQTLVQSLPCLPRVLREAGYRTDASHPYIAGFWSRDTAYRLLGFERYDSIRSFELDDFDGSLLTDASMFRQLRERQSDDVEGSPAFHYIVSLSSHFPFDRDRERRPDLVEVEPAAENLQNFANAMVYTTAALMDHIEWIQATDPEALIIAFGDHAPALGTHPDAYAESGVSLLDALEMTDAMVGVLQTPLLVIDGRDGPRKVGDVPLRSLPALVLDLLGVARPALPHLALHDARPDVWDAHQFISHVLLREAGHWRFCSVGATSCTSAAQVLERLATIRRDLTMGGQYSLALTGSAAISRPVSMQQTGGHADCIIDAEDWTPKRVVQRQPFNRLPDGSSALWITLREGRGTPSLSIGRDRAELTIGGTHASAAFADPRFVRTPGRYPVRWDCPDGSSGKLGDIVVTDKAEPDALLPAAPAPIAATPAPARCSAKVLDVEPRRVSAESSFHVQGDGKSSFWVQLESGSEGFTLRGPEGEIAYSLNDELGAMSFTKPSIFDQPVRDPTKVRFELLCGERVEDGFDVEHVAAARSADSEERADE
jgi:hypothetical protein